MTRKRIFSGIQPTGALHLGNYLGALRNWVVMQEQGECLFCIVDLHALTSGETSSLRDDIHTSVAAYLAAGLDPERAIIYSQSAVSGHAELQWLLACFTPLGWLNRMTQFKEKAGKKRENAVLGLYAYPVLMAADILLYKATHVPVGDDQKQHLELCRDIAQAFNNHYGRDVFPLPQPHILEESGRIMSLRDGTKKMSKTDISDYSRINLLDEDDVIRLKIQKARSDSALLPAQVSALAGRPEAMNLLTIYAAITGNRLAQVCRAWQGQTFSALKADLAERLIDVVSPIRERMKTYLAARDELDVILRHGAERARALAEPTWQELRGLVGLG